MKTIQLYGPLAAEFGPTHRIAVESPQEAFRAMSVRQPAFLAALKAVDCVLVRRPSQGARLDEEGIEAALSDEVNQVGPDTFEVSLGAADLHIVSFVHGESGKGVGKVLLGVALIAGAWVSPVGGVALAGGTATAGTVSAFGMSVTYGQIALIGATMALQGVAQLTSASPTSAQTTNSFTISGQDNLAQQGVPVPLIYGGPIRVGSVEISTQVNTGAVTANGTIVQGGQSGNITGGGGSIVGISYVDHSLIQEAG